MRRPTLRHNGVVRHLQERSWRFWIILGYVVVALVFIAGSFAFVYRPISQQMIDRQTINLTATAQAQAQALATTKDADVFVSAVDHNTDLRTTIIKSDGTVIADSEIDISLMTNHADREEVAKALTGSIGSTLRTSESDGIERLYVAVPATYQNEYVVVRVSEPSTAFESLTQSAQTSAVMFAIVGILVIAFVAALSIKQSTIPFRRFDQVRSDFVANASHELKTPVAGIRLLSEAIRDAAEIDDKKSLVLFIDRLDNEAERLQRLVVDLLDLSRLEEHPNTDRSPRTDLHSTVVTSLVAHKGQGEDKGLDLTLEDRSRPGDDCYAEIEPSDASLIFDNLIENAIMYTDEGSICVTFEPRGHEIAIIVRDTGIGIPQAYQSRIFERFYRVDKARSREVGGTGLGLSLVRHAIERSHGTIRVKSVVNEGSEFTVIFPRIKRNR